jgi:hypothetical protein
MNDHLTGWLTGLAKAVAVAAVLGGGGALISTKSDVAVLQSQQTNVEKSLERIEGKLDRVIEREVK